MLKTFPGPAYLHSENEIVWLWHLLVNLDIHSSPFYFATTQSQYLMVNGRDGGLNTVSYLQVCLSVEGAKNVSWPWLSPFRGWDSLWHFQVNLDIYIWLTILSCYGSIPLLHEDREGWWFEHSASWLHVSWPWLSQFQGWDSLTIYTHTYIYKSINATSKSKENSNSNTYKECASNSKSACSLLIMMSLLVLLFSSNTFAMQVFY